MLNVPSVDAEPGSRVELRDVLLLADGDKVTVGSPNVADAVVVVEVIEHGKGRKVVNFKYKAKVRYRRKRGHRQGFTALRVREIRLGDAPAAPAPSRRRTRAVAEDAPADEAPVAEATEITEAVETPVVEAPAPRRRRRTSTETTETTQE
jgi:large subunit ribosomal protein L21